MVPFEKFSEQLRRIYSGDPSLDAIPLETILDTIPRVDELESLPGGTTILIRIDLDMPIKDGIVADFSRIEANSRTVRYCMDRRWKVILFGHLGRDKTVSVSPVSEAMSQAVGTSIELVQDWLDESTLKLRDEFVERVLRREAGCVFMLENTRKYALEQALWHAPPEIPGDLSRAMHTVAADIRRRLSEVEINEAIAASNFDFSSAVLPLAMDKTALGFYISEEMKTHVRGARFADFVVVSGQKLNKLDDLEAILHRGQIRWLIVAGALAMALKKGEARVEGRSFSVGRGERDRGDKSYISPEREAQGERIVRACRHEGIRLLLPVDFVLDDERVVDEIDDDRVQLDIGPKTRALMASFVDSYLEEKKRSVDRGAVFYNGVFGRFEDERFETGTKEFIGLLAKLTGAGIRTYVGGGEGRLALLRYGSLRDVTHAFTAGGTILKSLSDKHIWFLKAMYLQNSGQ